VVKTYWSVAAICSVLFSIPPFAAGAVTGTVDPVNGMLTTSASLSYSYPKVDGTVIPVVTGNTVYKASLTVGGVARDYLVMRPSAVTSGAPLLILLHPRYTSPAQMANLTKVANFQGTLGFWVALPYSTAAENTQWHSDPRTDPADDVQFVSALIDALVAQGVDAGRVYAAGYSEGGMMSERLACELPAKIAAFGLDAATLLTDATTYCHPSIQRPKLYILGTADTIVPYDGGRVGLMSAAQTLGFWSGSAQQGCAGTTASMLPTVVNDGTTVQLTDYSGCAAGGDLRLYTVYNGGHAWPNGLTQSAGKTTQNLDATGIIWSFASAYRR
jgi:polyhydroxybutyrate depolymerase